MANIITKENLTNSFKDYLTVGQLRKFLENNPDIPSDTKVLVQRVEDVYFEKHNWGTYRSEGFHFQMAKIRNEQMAEEIKRRETGEESQFSKLVNPEDLIIELNDDLKDHYHPAFCIYVNEDIVFINQHY